jgi:hypothetical protein
LVSDVTNKGVDKCRAARLRCWGTTDAIDNVHVIWQVHHDSALVGESVAALTGSTAAASWWRMNSTAMAYAMG